MSQKYIFFVMPDDNYYSNSGVKSVKTDDNLTIEYHVCVPYDNDASKQSAIHEYAELNGGSIVMEDVDSNSFSFPVTEKEKPTARYHDIDPNRTYPAPCPIMSNHF